MAAQLADPVRIVLVIASLWLISKLYDPGSPRLIANAVALIVVAVIMAAFLASSQTLGSGPEWWAQTILVGVVSNFVLWCVCAALLKAYRWQVED